jgi:hypothetical protein
LVERNLAKVEVESSRLFSRSTFMEFRFLFFAGVAQLVERNLAKVEVESSRLFSRSKFKEREAKASLFCQEIGAIANRLCNGLQIRLAQFDSGSRLH